MIWLIVIKFSIFYFSGINKSKLYIAYKHRYFQYVDVEMSQELHITCIWPLLKWVVGLTEGWILSETLYKIQNFYQSKLIWESHSPASY